GSALLGSGIRTELRRELLERILVEGFFPRTDSSARPLPRPRAALTQIGLPYAADPAITKHLASFLGRQVHATRDLPGFEPPATATLLHPTAVLFNGGVVKARVLRERLLDTLNHWLEADGAPPVRVLTGEDLDLAVARGAAYYGRVRRGRGLRIRGGPAWRRRCTRCASPPWAGGGGRGRRSRRSSAGSSSAGASRPGASAWGCVAARLRPSCSRTGNGESSRSSRRSRSRFPPRIVR